MRPEANIEAAIEAGRVNLAKKSSKDLKEAAATSKKLRRHPSAAESDQIPKLFRITKMKCTILFTFMKTLKICMKTDWILIYHIYQSGIMHH